MQDLKRLLKYLKPNIGTFIIAFVAMIIGAIFETARLGLIGPVFSQVLSNDATKSKNSFLGIENFIPESWIPDSGVESWSTIAVLFLSFTIIKSIADYFSQYLMGYIGQSAVLQLRQDLYNHLLQQSTNSLNSGRNA